MVRYVLGICNGFQLVSNFSFRSVEVENYKSALDPLNKDMVEEQIKTELLEGRYQIVSEKPAIVSALGAIRKSNGKIRLIHDASRPSGGALNEYAEELDSLSFQSVADATDLLSHNAYMSKIDFIVSLMVSYQAKISNDITIIATMSKIQNNFIKSLSFLC